MSRIAVVGAGISGLAASWLLSRRHEVLLFERAERLGGHTHTHLLDTPDGRLALDTGFLVHNDRTYPMLVRLFAELGVDCVDSDMSFAVTCSRTGFEFSTRDLNGLFADRRNVLRPGHYKLLIDIVRFNRAARRLLRAPEADRLTIGEFLERGRFRGDVVHRFVLPLASAIWSASLDTIHDFPALTVARFFDQHGFLNVASHPTWKTIRGGAASYVPRLIHSPRVAVFLNAGLRAVVRTGDGVRLTFTHRPDVRADEMVFACHGDEVLPMLADPTPAEREVLGAFRTTANEAWLHMDDSLLPRRQAARASWNYLLGPDAAGATVTYHLNRLQRLQATREYCVTLNPRSPIAPDQILAKVTYTHPLYTRGAIASQARWTEVSGVNHTHYCGAYWFYGFHEDGLRSAVRVASALGVRW